MNKPVYVMEAHFIEKQIQIAVQELQTPYNSQLNSIKNQIFPIINLYLIRCWIDNSHFIKQTKMLNKTTTQVQQSVSFLWRTISLKSENQIQLTWMHIL